MNDGVLLENTFRITNGSDKEMSQAVGQQQFSTVAVGDSFRVGDEVYEKIDRFTAIQILRNEDGTLEPLTAIPFSSDALVWEMSSSDE